MFDFLFKSKRRAALRAKPFPAEWSAILARNTPFTAQLSPEDLRELEGHVQVFLAEKSFEGCGGLELTDEIRVTIAAQACLLLLHRETDVFPLLDVVLVYPHAFVSPVKRRDATGVVTEEDSPRQGESSQRGMVVLAWDHVLRGAASIHDGHNVVFHEFAHQLDAEDGAMEGAPVLSQRGHVASWAHVLGDEYGELVARVEKHRSSDLDSYGATSPAEFFAVVTEAFFEQPKGLKKKHPALYEELASFYQQDPSEWGARSK
jgi:Mlc titration factor MtfA (ptsG expression regulator)